MKDAKKVLIFGAAGRVGLGLFKELLRHNIDISVVDFVDKKQLSEKISRIIVDHRLSHGDVTSQVNMHGNVDVLNEGMITDILTREKPDIVVNYAIPFTWGAAKKLPNYDRISQAGLGAFAAVQVLAPKIIAQALAASGINATYIVGNLPDITIPIIYGLKKHQQMVLPIAGAGNVGLIEAALNHQIALERKASVNDLRVYLVAHHVHWVQPREPGYRNDAPFLLKVMHQDKDITEELGDLRQLINRSIVNCYEPGAGFSSTTALLAAKLVLSLLDEEGNTHKLHVPAPNGLPGGYPVTVKGGKLKPALPPEWQLPEAEDLMKQAHTRDGIDKIAEDGSIHFDHQSISILRDEIGFNLPDILRPADLESVAKDQIRMAQNAISII